MLLTARERTLPSPLGFDFSPVSLVPTENFASGDDALDIVSLRMTSSLPFFRQFVVFLRPPHPTIPVSQLPSFIVASVLVPFFMVFLFYEGPLLST